MALIDNLRAYYKLDETSGTNINDEVNTLDLTASGVTLNQTGIIGTSVLFGNNTSHRIYGGTNFGNLLLGSTGFSISCWIYKTEARTANNYVMSCDAGGNQFLYFRYGNPNSLHFDYLANNGGVNAQLAFSTLPSLNAWHHLVATVNSSGTCELYLDGADNGGGASGIPNTFSVANGGAIGAYWSGSSSFGGRIDEFGIWDRVLTPTEVSQLYNAGAGLAYPFTTTPIFTPYNIIF